MMDTSAAVSGRFGARTQVAVGRRPMTDMRLASAFFFLSEYSQQSVREHERCSSLHDIVQYFYVDTRGPLKDQARHAVVPFREMPYMVGLSSQDVASAINR